MLSSGLSLECVQSLPRSDLQIATVSLPFLALPLTCVRVCAFVRNCLCVFLCVYVCVGGTYMMQHLTDEAV